MHPFVRHLKIKYYTQCKIWLMCDQRRGEPLFVAKAPVLRVSGLMVVADGQ